jgi:hypothetical protein
MATVELNWSEVCILLDAAAARWAEWNDRAMHGQSKGWRDAKEKDRVLTHQHLTWELVEKLTEAKRGFSNG